MRIRQPRCIKSKVAIIDPICYVSIMSKTVTISDDLAAVLEARRRASGHATIDAAAESLVARGLLAEAEDDHSAGRTVEELRALIDEAEASGPAERWDSAAARAEVLRRHAERRRG
jgi:hypothetical protein